LVQTLIDGNAPLDLEVDEMPPVCAALENGYSAVAALLMSAGAEAGGDQYLPEEMLKAAAKGGCADILAQLLARGGDPNTRDEEDRTLLALASDPDTLRVLLDAKADVNPDNCQHVLLASVEADRPDAVKLLLDAGATVKGMREPSDLFFALSHRCPPEREERKMEVLRLLLDAGIPAHDAIRGCGPALGYITYGCYDRLAVRMAALLLERRPEAAADLRSSGRMQVDAARCADLRLLEYLISLGADVTLCEGRPLLLFAYQALEKDAVRARAMASVLRGAGADILAVNDQGASLVCLALDPECPPRLTESAFDALVADVAVAVGGDGSA
jgi:hypothetical protein